MTWLRRFVEATLVEPVPRDHRQPDHMFRRRRVVSAVTLAVGATLLGFSLATEPGDPVFYTLTFALAATWAVGAFVSGPLHVGRIPALWGAGRPARLVGPPGVAEPLDASRAAGSAGSAGSTVGRWRRPVLEPILIGLAAVAVFTVGGLIVAQIPPLRSSVEAVLDHAEYGSLPVIALVTVVNGVAEELFFRGGLYAAIGRRAPVLLSTGIYALTTVATGNVMLVFAATLLGLLTGLQRRVTGGVLAPMLTHVTWSLGMLFILPPLMSAFG